ncbi:MAG: hypothetical protein K0U47_08855 [Epsilonproteobacteria bacterium]|nr:hypothetical protein [Campylobacterota bacterium]
MKTFFTLLVLIIGFFIYLFFPKDNTQEVSTSSKEPISLEEVEKISNSENTQEIKSYLTLSKEAPTSIPEDQTFDMITTILQSSSTQNNKSDVTLNTQINTFLYTLESQEKFKQNIASTFNLSYDEVDTLYSKNKIVWDWVNTFKE